MRRPAHEIRAAAIVVGALAAAVAVVFLARSWASAEGGSYEPSRAVAATQLEPSSVLFGDPVTATARIVVDTRTIDPATISLEPSFKPFQAFATTRTLVRGVGKAAEVRYVFTIQCVTGACVNAMEQEQRGGAVRTVPIQLPAATVTALARDGSPVRLDATWPPLTVHSRLTADDVARGEPVAPTFAPAGDDSRASADTVGGVLTTLAIVLLIIAGLLTASVVLSRRRERQLRLPAHLGPIDRALALARHAISDGDLDGGRKALERASSELEQSGRVELAETAGRMAWSPPGPTVDEVEDLARLVRSGANGR